MAGGRKRRAKKEGVGNRQKLLAVVLVVVLAMCGVSVTVGVMNWMTRARSDDITDRVRMEVLNGTGKDGLGKAAARALMRKKVDVLLVGNADGFDYPQTVLIARKDKPEIKTLGELLGCERFIEQLRDDTLVDATLIIGADYGKLDLGLEDDSNLSE